MFFTNTWKALLWAFIVLILSSIPSGGLKSVSFISIPHMDKFVHFCMYFILATLLIEGFSRQFTYDSFRIYPGMYAILFSIAYGIAMELLQAVISTGRSMELWDMAANSTGAVAAHFLYPLSEKFLSLIYRVFAK